jgi:hypothetical protein
MFSYHLFQKVDHCTTQSLASDTPKSPEPRGRVRCGQQLSPFSLHIPTLNVLLHGALKEVGYWDLQRRS